MLEDHLTPIEEAARAAQEAERCSTNTVQRAGQMLQEGKKAGQLKKPGDARCPGAITSSIGITRNESSEFQKLAAVPERVSPEDRGVHGTRTLEYIMEEALRKANWQPMTKHPRCPIWRCPDDGRLYPVGYAYVKVKQQI